VIRLRVSGCAFAAVAAGCIAFMAAPALAQTRFAPPPGEKVVSGRHFDVYVLKKAEQPVPGDYVSRVYQVTFLAHTQKHGIQRITQRIETLDADGLDDVRYLAQKTKGGCAVWPAMRWETDHERFTQGGPQLARSVDAHGKAVKNCVLR
jgi:hypothetical protein